MDFVERIFHMSPDEGSGSFEVLLVLVILAIVVVLLIWRAKRQTRKRL